MPDYADPKQAWNDRNQDKTRRDFNDAHNQFDIGNKVWGWASGGNNNPLVAGVHSAVGTADNASNIMWQAGDEEVFNQMDQRQWNELSNKQPEYQRNWIETRRKWLKEGKVKPGTFYDPQTGKSGMTAGDQAAETQRASEADIAKAKEAAYQKWRDDTMRRLDTFSKEMNMPVEELIAKGDLGVRNAGSNANSQSSSAAYGAGLGEGGVSNMNTQRAVTDAQSKYQLQRAGLGLQATNSLLGTMGDMSREREDQLRYDQNMDLQLQGANMAADKLRYGEQTQRNGQLLGLAGGVIGGMYGGPQGAAFGYQAGSSLGSGLASKPYQPTNYKAPSSTRSSGLGRNPYGGSQ